MEINELIFIDGKYYPITRLTTTEEEQDLEEQNFDNDKIYK